MSDFASHDPMTPDTTRIGFVGLGAMGTPMARRLIHSGFRLAVYDIVPAAVHRLSEDGAVACPSPAAVAQASDLVITMLPNSPEMEAVMLGPDGIVAALNRGQVVMDMSTIDPTTTQRVAAEVGRVGARMLDAPVGRTSRHAEEGTLLAMVGGDADLLEVVRPVLSVLASDIVHCGAVGNGGIMKLVNNLLTTTIVVANAEALTVGVAAGLDLTTMLQVLRSTAASNTHLTVTYKEKALAGDLTPGFATRLASKDLGLALALAARHRVPVNVGAAAQQSLSLARSLGHDDDDYTSIVAALAQLSGVEIREDSQHATNTEE